MTTLFAPRYALGRSVKAAWICSSCLVLRLQAQTQRARSSVKASRYASTQSIAESRDARQGKRDGKLPNFPARTRFAPSPTGIMHIGGLRTAIFSYLLAKRTGGQFILRIEDTDQKRFVPGAQERICDDLQWAGLQWDEGPGVGGKHGPYQQSQRTEIYQRHAEELLDEGAAYRCFCTAQTSGSGSAAYVTSGCYQDCSSRSPGDSRQLAQADNQRFTIRLKQSPDFRKGSYPDLVYGNIKRLKRSSAATSSTNEEDDSLEAADTILLKSDGTPTYHFANVVDDHLMEITHVIRGTEWMASTPLHYDLYHAFGWEPPLFAHVGLLLDKNKAKLSKRNADLALDVRGLRDEHGVLPETLCNFLALQGWSNPTKNDVMNMKELIRNFDLKFTTGNTMIGMEKLWFLQKHHVQRRCDLARSGGDVEPIMVMGEQIATIALKRFPNLREQLGSVDAVQAYCQQILLADDKSYQDPAQYVDRNWYFFDFDSALVPPAQDSYDANRRITEADLLVCVQDIFESTNEVAAKGDNDKLDFHERLVSLQKTNDLVHAVIVRHIWLHALGREVGSDLSKVAHATARPDEIAKALAPDIEQAGIILGKYKTWQKAVMKYLRERLCCGSPGPSMGYVIALLGLEECKRRLEMQ